MKKGAVQEALALNQKMQPVSVTSADLKSLCSRGTCAESEDATPMKIIEKLLDSKVQEALALNQKMQLIYPNDINPPTTSLRGTCAESEDATV